MGLRARGLHSVGHVHGHAEVGQYDALWHRRGAAGVDDDRGVRVLHVGEDLLRLLGCEELLVGGHALGVGVVADEVLYGLELGPEGGDVLQVAFSHEHGFGLGVVHHVGELFLLGAVVEGYEDSAQLGAGVVGLDVGDGVEGDHRHLIALADAQSATGGEGVGQAVHPLLELAEGAAFAVADHSDTIGHHRGGDHQELGRVHPLPPNGPMAGSPASARAARRRSNASPSARVRSSPSRTARLARRSASGRRDMRVRARASASG